MSTIMQERTIPTEEVVAEVIEGLENLLKKHSPSAQPVLTLSDDQLAELEQAIANGQRFRQGELDSSPEAVEKMVQDAENHANEQDAKERQRAPSLVDLWVREQLMDKRSFVNQYVTASAEVRMRTQMRALDENALAKAQFTPAEVAEMLRMFQLLDRLVDPSQEFEEAQKRENAKYNVTDLEQMRRNLARMRGVSNGLENEVERNEADHAHQISENEPIVDLTKLRYHAEDAFEKAIQNLKKDSMRLDKTDPTFIVDPRHWGRQLEKFGVPSKQINSKGMKRFSRIVENALRLSLSRIYHRSGFDPWVNAIDSKTGEAHLPFSDRSGIFFGREVQKAAKSEFVRAR